nr:GPW/gp25 family protein [Allokutzneria sp. NRRL B-24872]
MGVGPTGGIALVRREQELEQAMRLILSTYPGERPMRPAFGSRLRDFIFRSTDPSTAAELVHEVRQALLRWEPRVDVADVRATPDEDDPSVLYLDIQYVTKGTNDPRNLVFPFYTVPDDGTDY